MTIEEKAKRIQDLRKELLKEETELRELIKPLREFLFEEKDEMKGDIHIEGIEVPISVISTDPGIAPKSRPDEKDTLRFIIG